VRRLEDPGAGTSVRLSKGAHVVVAAESEWSAALTVPQDTVRVTFAVPFYRGLLLGTTESEYEGDPADVGATPEDVDQILGEAAIALDPALVRPERVRAAFAGLRVLPAGAGESVSARRETVYTIGRAGMLSVAGGKLTTYRRIALGVLERLRGELGLRRVDGTPWPLPGATLPARMRIPQELDSDVWAHLTHLYGGLAEEVLAPAALDPALLERLHPDGPDIAAQALYAFTHEWAGDVEDVLRRRTTLFFRGLADGRAAERIEALRPAAG
jgi:glycerol-3-phosphate dehydrogenase